MKGGKVINYEELIAGKKHIDVSDEFSCKTFKSACFVCNGFNNHHLFKVDYLITI